MGRTNSPFDDESVVDPENATQNPVGDAPPVDPAGIVDLDLEAAESQEPEPLGTGIFVQTPIGHAFDSSVEGIPLITNEPTEVTQEQADHLLNNSEGLVRLVETKED